MNQTTNKTYYLSAQDIVRYLLNLDEDLDTLITCAGSEKLATHDHTLYEALGSLKPYDELKTHRLIKLLEVVNVAPYRATHGARPVLTHERVESIRTEALRQR